MCERGDLSLPNLLPDDHQWGAAAVYISTTSILGKAQVRNDLIKITYSMNSGRKATRIFKKLKPKTLLCLKCWKCSLT